MGPHGISIFQWGPMGSPCKALTLMSLPLKQAIIRKKRFRPSKVMTNLVRACIAGNAKNKQNRPTLPRDFSATAGDKNSRLVLKLVLRHALSGNIHLVQFGSGRENFVLEFRRISLYVPTNNLKLQSYSRKSIFTLPIFSKFQL